MASLYPRTQREQLMVLLGIIGLAAGALYYFYVFGPKMTELAAVQTRIDSLDVNIARARAQLSKGTVADIRAEADRNRESLDLMRQLVPASNEVPSLLEQVSNAARRAGLDVGTVEPLGVEEGRTFNAHRYRLRVAGDYHGMTEFLANVGSLPRIVAPMNLDMNAASLPGRPKMTVSTGFELQTFVMRSGPASATGATK